MCQAGLRFGARAPAIRAARRTRLRRVRRPGGLRHDLLQQETIFVRVQTEAFHLARQIGP
jgi:hypothetical protein